MSESLQTRIEKLKAHLRARIEEWEKATGKKWEHDGENINAVNDRGPCFCIAEAVFDTNALCIASSRTETPRALKLLLEDVELHEKRLNYTPVIQKGDSYHEGVADGKDVMKAHLYCESIERLTAILDAYKEEIE